jgi:type IV pilus assembly protein PilA
MNIRILMVGGILLLAGLAGCQKKEAETAAVKPGEATPAPAASVAPPAPKPVTLEIVKETERSRHFLAVNRQLELGGTLYGYADIDGDALKLAGALQNIITEVAKAQPQAAAQLNQDYAALFKILGLTDIQAVGLSSVEEGTGFFRNRVFFYTPEGRHGLLAGLGGEPKSFERLALAPANTDVYSENEIDLPAVYKAINAVVAKVGGDVSANKMEAALKQAGQEAAISALSIVQNWKGRSALVVRMEDGLGFRMPGRDGIQLPAFSLLLTIDGIAPSLHDALVKFPMFNRRQEGTLELFELKMPVPVESLKPLIAIDGSTLMIATSPKFLSECLEAKGGLAQTADFQKAIAPFGTKANGIGYISPRFFTKLHELETLNAHLTAEPKRVLALVLANLPKIDRPLVTVRTNLPEGILIQSYWNRSLKQDVAVLAFYNPVTVGLLAAMAIPAFQKVKTSSQEKTVMNNLRQLASAADQYYLEEGRTTATYDDLVGPNKYVRMLKPVDGEDYTQIKFKANQPLQVQLSSGKVIQYPLE